MPDLPWMVYAIPLAMVGLVAFAVFYKYLEVQKVAWWPQAPGKVVVSTSEQRPVGSFDDGGGSREDIRNFAKIVYEYEVSGQKMRASRVSIGEDMGNFMVEETIARYPVGKAVTVYYNPRRPKEAVLEREMPKGVFGCAIIGIVVSLIGIFATFFGLNQLAIYARQFMVNPDHTPIVIGLGTIGMLFLLFAFVLRWQRDQVRSWPKVTGRIVRSELDDFRGTLNPDDHNIVTLYRPKIVYAYEYNGIKYSGETISFGAEVTANRQVFANKLIAKYPLGKVVEVHVNPQNASDAVLESKPAYAWIIWLAAAVLLGGAYFISQQP